MEKKSGFSVINNVFNRIQRHMKSYELSRDMLVVMKHREVDLPRGPGDK
jgi:hypothetical protein